MPSTHHIAAVAPVQLGGGVCAKRGLKQLQQLRGLHVQQLSRQRGAQRAQQHVPGLTLQAGNHALQAAGGAIGTLSGAEQGGRALLVMPSIQDCSPSGGPRRSVLESSAGCKVKTSGSTRGGRVAICASCSKHPTCCDCGVVMRRVA